VYRSYGIHACINAVTEPEGVGAAVLIRALEPIEGMDLMRARRGLERVEALCSGPGKLTQALGIELDQDGVDLAVGPITISEPPPGRSEPEVIAGTRIGLTKAAELPWRFCARDSRFLSRRAI
jgi:DNA-3-methyladenine glycosylase